MYASQQRLYATSFSERMASRVASMKKLVGDPYANRERGDLSEYSHKLHGLSMMSGGRDLEVLRAWDRGDFTTVLDICFVHSPCSHGSFQLHLVKSRE